MRQFRTFVAAHRAQLFLLAVVVFAVCNLAACALPTWIQDAQNVLPIVGEMAAGIIALIAAFTSGPDAGAIATLNTVITAISKSLTDIQNMVDEYNSSPSTSLLTEIENAIKAVSDGITQLMNDTGLTNTALQSKVVAILQLMLNEVTAWASIIPALDASAGDKITITVPFTKKESKALYNNILNTPTGNAAVDAQLTKLKRL